jgi:LysM repeat protein
LLYNYSVKRKTLHSLLLLIILLASTIRPASNVQAVPPASRLSQDSGVTAYDLIIAMNTLRVSYGYPALVEDPIIDAVAQSTAEIMAANSMSWHIGDVSGRLASAGYGGGAKVQATENFAAGASYSIDQIMVVWSDESHMLPAVNSAYCNVGAGVAKSPNGLTYYVLQAAYTSGKSCGTYTSSGGKTTSSQGSTTTGNVTGVSQVIVPVKIATPDAEGKIYHVVEAGQSFWSIAIAYQITIKDIETWNNIKKESKLQVGQKLFIPDKNTAGYVTPTPVGMVQTSTPDPDGKIVHTVQTYQTLSTIATAYGVDVNTLLALNGIQMDWPLQIGQKLIIRPSQVTPSPTPRPLTPLEKLTPDADGKYYHVIKNGENLSWIASLYNVTVAELEAWNSLSDASMVQPEQKLLLLVTPPVTITPTPGPATETPTPTQALPTATATISGTLSGSETAASPAVAPQAPRITMVRQPSIIALVVILGLAAGIFLAVFLQRKK